MTSLVAKAYLRFDEDWEVDRVSPEQREKLQAFGREMARETLSVDVDVSLTLRKGSLIVEIAAFGGFFVLLVTQYGSLRQGIDYIVKDGKKFSEGVAQYVDGVLGTEHDYMQRRRGLPGKTQRLFKSCDKLSAELSSFSEYEWDVPSERLRALEDDLRHVAKEYSAIQSEIEDPQELRMFRTQGPKVQLPISSMPEQYIDMLPPYSVEPYLSGKAFFYPKDVNLQQTEHFTQTKQIGSETEEPET